MSPGLGGEKRAQGAVFTPAMSDRGPRARVGLCVCWGGSRGADQVL